MSRCYSSYGYGDYYQDRSSWFTKYRLTGGSAWHNHYARANIAFAIITVLALVAILIWSFTVRKGTPAARTLFRCFIAAISFAIFSLTWAFIDLILNEECVVVERLYAIFNILFQYLLYLADILLLAATLILLVSCMAFTGIIKPRSTSKVSAIYFAFCGVLGIIWLTILALALRLVVESVEKYADVRYDLVKAARKLNFVWHLLYLFAVFQILIWSTVLLSSAKGGNGGERKKSILCLVLIGVALFAREIWQSVIDGILALGTVEERYRALTIKTAFADQMFYYICTIIAYAALAVAMGSMQAGPTEANQSRADDKPQLAASEPSWRRTSMRAHSQDPIYNGPGVVRDV